MDLDKGYFPSHPEVDGDQEQLYFAGDTALWITGNWEVGNITEKTDLLLLFIRSQVQKPVLMVDLR